MNMFHVDFEFTYSCHILLAVYLFISHKKNDKKYNRALRKYEIQESLQCLVKLYELHFL
jgi:hypothetical protein